METARPQEVEAAAERRFAVQLKQVLERSPFYAAKLSGAGRARLADLHRLPFTTKEELKDAAGQEPPFGSNLCVPAAQVKLVYQTSGTSGAPSVIALTQADVETWTSIGTRTYFATGIHEHHSVLSTFGAGPFVAGHTHHALRRIGVRSVPVGPGETERVLFGLRAGLADTLLATPSFAQHLANRWLWTDSDPQAMALTHVVTGGEPGGGIPAIRDHVERVLGVTVNEVMGLGDVAPSLFGECPAQLGMHFSGTGHVWPELVDPDSGDAVGMEAGAVGELVYTSLSRQAMPVIRFLSGDVVRIEGNSCACGRTSFRIRCLGRRDDMFIVRGVNVYPSAILALVGEFRPRVTGRARVVRAGREVSVEPPVPIEVELAAGTAADPALAGEMEAVIRARLTFRGAVRLVPESEFGDSAYKTRLSVTRQ